MNLRKTKADRAVNAEPEGPKPAEVAEMMRRLTIELNLAAARMELAFKEFERASQEMKRAGAQLQRVTSNLRPGR